MTYGSGFVSYKVFGGDREKTRERTDITRRAGNGKADTLRHRCHSRHDNYWIEGSHTASASERRRHRTLEYLMTSVNICEEYGCYLALFGKLGHPLVIFQCIF